MTAAEAEKILRDLKTFGFDTVQMVTQSDNEWAVVGFDLALRRWVLVQDAQSLRAVLRGLR